MAEANIKVLIVDDEPFARKYIRELLKDHRDLVVIGEAGNGKAAMRAMAKERPDIIFLDIQMPEMDGFTLLQNLSVRDLPVIIFTTAYEEYAVRAFEVHAVDYLLKPFDQQRFGQAIEHARSLISDSASHDLEQGQIVELLRSISEKPKFLERILIKQHGRIIFLKIEDIDWVRADDKYLYLHHGASRHMIRQTLSGLRSQLDPKRFVQINRSVLVKVDRIRELHPMFNGEYEVKLIDGTTFPLSRSHRNELFDLLGKPVS